jgi:hypothetical protein
MHTERPVITTICSSQVHQSLPSVSKNYVHNPTVARTKTRAACIKITAFEWRSHICFSALHTSNRNLSRDALGQLKSMVVHNVDNGHDMHNDQP